MQEALYGWVRLLLIGTVCMQLVLQFVTGKEYRQYIRLFLSMLFLLVACRPLLSVTGLSETMEKTVEDWIAGQEYREVLHDRAFYMEREDTLLAEAVQQKVTEDVAMLLTEYDMELVRCDCQAELDTENAGIAELSVVMDAAAGKDTLSTDEKKTRTDAIRQRLAERYGMDIKDIRVSIRR